jgi:hypothetical protein
MLLVGPLGNYRLERFPIGELAVGVSSCASERVVDPASSGRFFLVGTYQAYRWRLLRSCLEVASCGLSEFERLEGVKNACWIRVVVRHKK